MSTLERGLKKLRIRLPDTPDRCGRSPYPQTEKVADSLKYPDTCGRGIRRPRTNRLCSFLLPFGIIMGYNRSFRKWTLEIIKIGASATGAGCKRKHRLVERKQCTAVDSLVLFCFLSYIARICDH